MTATTPPVADLVDVVIEDPAWEALDLPALASRAAVATLRNIGLRPDGFELCLLACDDARIASLNADFRGRAAPTNVLSWPAADPPPRAPGTHPAPPAPGDADDPESLGDIAIAHGVCTAEARAQGKRIEDHVTHLIVHAVLHLLGYDHECDTDAALMEQVEVSILASLGVDDPYRDGARAPQ